MKRRDGNLGPRDGNVRRDAITIEEDPADAAARVTSYVESLPVARPIRSIDSLDDHEFVDGKRPKVA